MTQPSYCFSEQTTMTPETCRSQGDKVVVPRRRAERNGRAVALRPLISLLNVDRNILPVETLTHSFNLLVLGMLQLAVKD